MEKLELNKGFCEMTETEIQKCEGGVADWVIYALALGGSFLIGHIVGYVAG